MKNVILAAALIALTGCSAVESIRSARSGGNPYEQDPFYAKYLDTGSALDARIRQAIDAVRAEPSNPRLHNELGALLIEKGFPKDAEREFERAVNADGRYYQAWYNLGLARAARGDEFGAWRALRRTVALKPGHAAALFQLGLIEEGRKHNERAVQLYAKAFRINPALLDVEVNPRILDSRLTHLALLRVYPIEHARASMQLQDAPVVRETVPVPSPEPEMQPAPSDQPRPAQIVPPAPPATDQGVQQTPATGGDPTRGSRLGGGSTRPRRPRRVEPPPPDPAQVEAPPAEIEEETPPFEPPPVTDETQTDESEMEQDEELESSEEEPPPPPPAS